jgi:hypothetical protein
LQALFPLSYFRNTVRNYASPLPRSLGGRSLPYGNGATSRPKAFLGGNR